MYPAANKGTKGGTRSSDGATNKSRLLVNQADSLSGTLDGSNDMLKTLILCCHQMVMQLPADLKTSVDAI